MRARQLSFFKASKSIHGGALAKGNPRHARPVSLKRPTHLVMRSSMAVGARSFQRKAHAELIEKIVRRQAKLSGVRIYDFANGGNHLHLIVRPSDRKRFSNFLRAMSGLIARAVLKAEKASPALRARGTSQPKFWDARPFTRIADWGRSYEILKAYLTLNKLEALGFVKWTARDHKRRRIMSVMIEPDIIPDRRQQRFPDVNIPR